ncbi:ketopantoate reductase PanE/ApbA C terminal-domain-containing protein [Paraphysoderma sedebokerense]|nr:ketopantoate reductase PanE/ApbA C terminal-domain-containing protein [Paraphysoderma sedebokerense]
MRLHIVGGGSIGTLLAFQLRKHCKVPVTLLLRPSSYQRYQTNNEIAITKNGQRYNERIDLQLLPSLSNSSKSSHLLLNSDNVVAPSDKVQNAKISTLVITTKSHQTIPSLTPLLSCKLIGPYTTLVFIQNGYGIFEDVVNLFKEYNTGVPKSVLMGITTHGAYRNDTKTETVWSGMGEWVFSVFKSDEIKGYSSHGISDSNDSTDVAIDSSNGERNDHNVEPPKENTTSQLISLFSSLPHSRVVPYSQFRRIQMQKLHINSIINPLTALLSIQNGQLLHSNSIQKTIDMLIEENYQLFKKLDLESDLGDRNRAFDKNVSELGTEKLNFTKEELRERVYQVMNQTANNWSSMYTDFSKNQETEIEYINGAIIKLGKKYGVDVKVNEVLYGLIKGTRDIRGF